MEEDNGNPSPSPSPLPPLDHVQLQFPCHHCKVSKVRCNRMMPCERCVRLNIHCQEQTRKPPGRPKKQQQQEQLNLSPPHEEGSDEAGASSSRPSRRRPRPRYLEDYNDDLDLDNDHHHHHDEQDVGGDEEEEMEKEDDDEEGEHSPEALRKGQWRRRKMASPSPSTDYFHDEVGGGGRSGQSPAISTGGRRSLTPTRADQQQQQLSWGGSLPSLIQRAAEVMSITFPHLKAKGKVDDLSVACLLQQWWLSKSRYGVDVTCGTLQAMLEVTGPSILEVSVSRPDPNLRPIDHSGASVVVGSQDDGGVTIEVDALPYYIKELWDTRAAVTGHVVVDGEYLLFCNSRFADTFMTAGEMYYKMGQLNSMPLLLYASILDPADVTSFYTKMVTYLCSPLSPLSEMCTIIRAVDRECTPRTSLARMRMVCLDQQSHRWVMALSVLELPKSQYVIPAPPSLAPTNHAIGSKAMVVGGSVGHHEGGGRVASQPASRGLIPPPGGGITSSPSSAFTTTGPSGTIPIQMHDLQMATNSPSSSSPMMEGYQPPQPYLSAHPMTEIIPSIESSPTNFPLSEAMASISSPYSKPLLPPSSPWQLASLPPPSTTTLLSPSASTWS